MNYTNHENESLWARMPPVKTQICRNKTTVLGISLYSCIAVYENWIL